MYICQSVCTATRKKDYPVHMAFLNCNDIYAKCICVIMTYEVSCTANGLFAIFFWPWFIYFFQYIKDLQWLKVFQNLSLIIIVISDQNHKTTFINNVTSNFVFILESPFQYKSPLRPSMSFYSDFIQILSRFYLDFIQILSRFYPDYLDRIWNPSI